MIPLRTSVFAPRFAAVTGLLIVLNVAAFVWELSLGERELVAAVTRHGVVPARQWQALFSAPLDVEAWLLPVFTSMFLHGGWLHLIGNMLFLWVFGTGVEARMGRWRFLVFYVAAGFLAAQAQAALDAASPIPMVGASGAIAGVLGAFLVLHPLAMVEVLVPIFFLPVIFPIPALFFLVFWFLEQLLFATALGLQGMEEVGGGVAWWAHAGGFLAGAVIAVALRRRDALLPAPVPARPRPSRIVVLRPRRRD